jgi:hypothetical protein
MTDEPASVPHYQGAQTLIFDEHHNEAVAWLDFPIWPPVGSVIELGNPNRDAVILGVRLQLPQAPSPGDGGALIVVLVDDPGSAGGILPRSVGEQILSAEEP